MSEPDVVNQELVRLRRKAEIAEASRRSEAAFSEQVLANKAEMLRLAARFAIWAKDNDIPHVDPNLLVEPIIYRSLMDIVMRRPGLDMTSYYRRTLPRYWLLGSKIGPIDSGDGKGSYDSTTTLAVTEDGGLKVNDTLISNPTMDISPEWSLRDLQKGIAEVAFDTNIEWTDPGIDNQK